MLNVIENQDCLEYLKNLPSESVNLAVIDEPYGVLTGHKIEDGYNAEVGLKVRREIYRVLKKDAWFCFFGQFPSCYDFYGATLEAGFKPWQTCNEIVWCKRTFSNPMLKMARMHENIFVFHKGKPQVYTTTTPYEDIVVDNAFHGIASFAVVKRAFCELMYCIKHNKTPTIRVNIRLQTNDPMYKKFNQDRPIVNLEGVRLPSIWSFSPQNHKSRNDQDKNNHKHPTVKPSILLRRLIKLLTQEGDTVLDCFMGSGTTAVASKQEGRNFYGCEKDASYCEMANARLDKWQEELEAENEWLQERDVNDFVSDIQHTLPNTNYDLFSDKK